MQLLAFLGMTSGGWHALGTMLLALAAVTGGLWAVRAHRLGPRSEAGRRLREVVSDLYVDDRFGQVRDLLEHRYQDEMEPLLERRLVDPSIPLAEQEARLLHDLDNALIYLDHVFHLERRGHLSSSDRRSALRFWLDLMEQPERAALRRYVARRGHDGLAVALNAERREHVAVYGAPRDTFGLPDRARLSGAFIHRGSCLIPGELYDLGDLPGLRPGAGAVVGKLFDVRDPAAIALLDDEAGYDPRAPRQSLHLRRAVQLLRPRVDAWVYFTNAEMNGHPVISSGDWAHHSAPQSH